MTVTFVTAFINLNESRPIEKSIEQYLTLFEQLQLSGIRLHVFVSPEYVDKVHVTNGIVEVLDFTDLFMYQHAPEGLPAIRNAEKDTRNYLILMNAKTELVKRAIDSNKHESSHYAWIDFGICHVFRTLQSTLKYLSSFNLIDLPASCLFIPGCTNKPTDITYDSILWRFCGGFFLGDKQSISAFYDLYVQYYPTLPKLTWEVNVWALFEPYQWNPSWYLADHNDSIVHIPHKQSIIRIPNNLYLYWYGELSKCYVKGPIERYVNKILQQESSIPALFTQSDSINEEQYTQLKETIPYSLVACLCTRNFHKDDLVYLPLDDETFEHGLLNTLGKYKRIPWEKKKSVVFWRGGTSGCEEITPRQRVVDMLFANPHCDVRFTRGASDITDSRIAIEKFAPSRVSIDDHFAYKYILIVDGNCIASSHQWVFGSGSVPIMVTHPQNQYWFQKFLQPMKNYVPIEYDLSDLEEKIEWLVTHETEAKAIMENAMYLASTLFSSEFQKAYVKNHIRSVLKKHPTLTVVIPCYKPHIPYLRECLDSIETQTVKPNQVIVVCSSTLPEDIPNEYKQYTFSCKFIVREDYRNQAQNRNEGSLYAKTEFVSFFDADDVMHPQRIETILSHISQTDILLHAYKTDNTTFQPISSVQAYYNQLIQSPTGCAVLNLNWNSLIHHSQVTVRKNVFDKIKFREEEVFKRREDSLLCGDILALPGIRNVYIQEPLSWYRLIQ